MSSLRRCLHAWHENWREKAKTPYFVQQMGWGADDFWDTFPNSLPHCTDSPWLLSPGPGCPGILSSISIEFWIVSWHIYIHCYLIFLTILWGKQSRHFSPSILHMGKSRLQRKGMPFTRSFKKTTTVATELAPKFESLFITPHDTQFLLINKCKDCGNSYSKGRWNGKET